MVQRKPARKRPKDPGAAPAGAPGSRGGAGGGGMPAAPLPNYMRATRCFGAKAAAAASGTPAAASGTPAAPQPQAQQGRAMVVQTAAAVPRAGRATCSSAMKGAGAGGPAHACPYAYCSFKVHAHAPPLGSFVAERRRLIKTQQSMKLKGASPLRKPSAGAGGFFVEIMRAGAAAAAPTVSRSGISSVEGDAAQGLGGASVDDGSCASSDVISVDSVEMSGTAKHRGREDREEEKTLVDVVMDHEGEDFGAGKSDISEELDASHGGNLNEGGIGDAPKESSVDSISSSLSGISFEDVSSACAHAASSQNKTRSGIAIGRRRRRTSEKGVKQMRPFNPKPPNFLPVEAGPEAEKVDLKHQDVDDRRAAEEWMVDYALRKEVRKLARAQKRKVEMLVQAFESVLPTVANEKKQPEQHDDNGDKRTFTLAWPPQACS